MENQRLLATQAEGHYGKMERTELFWDWSWTILSNLRSQHKMYRSDWSTREHLLALLAGSACAYAKHLLHGDSLRYLPATVLFPSDQASLPYWADLLLYATSPLYTPFTQGRDFYTEVQVALHDVICAICAFARKSSLPLAKAKSPRLGAPPAAQPPLFGGS